MEKGKICRTWALHHAGLRASFGRAPLSGDPLQWAVDVPSGALKQTGISDAYKNDTRITLVEQPPFVGLNYS